MKAIIWTKYGSPDGLVLKDIEKPVAQENEVLIRVRATSVFAGDAEMRALKLPMYFKIPLRLFFGLRSPRDKMILGQELAGEIEEVGEKVTNYQPGDRIFAAMGFDMGSYAEYKVMKANPTDGAISLKPENMSFEEAATLPVGGLHALHFIREAKITQGQQVLINGAGGSIGIIAIQLAKYYGAEVTVVDSTEKLEVLKRLGADYTIDYNKEDYRSTKMKYDVIFDVVGRNAHKNSFFGGFRSLKPEGIYMMANPKLRHSLIGKLLSKFSSKQIIASMVHYQHEDLLFLKKLVEDGVITTYIDRQYDLDEIVQAHQYVDSGKKIGNISVLIP